MKAGTSLCGEAGGVWKLSPWAPKEKEKKKHSDRIRMANTYFKRPSRHVLG